MLFADPTDFAVEAEFVFATQTGAPFGHYRFHIGGAVVGEYGVACTLGGCVSSLQAFLQRPAPLWEPAFDGLSREAIHDAVWAANYGDPAAAGASAAPTLHNPRRYDFMTNWGVPFDHFGAVIIEPKDGRFEVLHQPYGDAERFALFSGFSIFNCTRAGMTAAAAEFARWVETLNG